MKKCQTKYRIIVIIIIIIIIIVIIIIINLLGLNGKKPGYALGLCSTVSV